MLLPILQHRLAAALAAALLVRCVGAGAVIAEAEEEERAVMKISSSAFANNGSIPAKYTCTGSDTSPPLAWSDVPAGTKSLALIMDDPDAPDPAAPKRTWVHWVAYNIPPATTSLAEGAGNHGLPSPARTGLNDWSRADYGGPCPPVGRHRYYLKLYALDVALPDLTPPTKAALEAAMQGHVLGQAVLLGTFEK